MGEVTVKPIGKAIQSVPNLRFPKYQENIKRFSFEDVFDFSTGKNIKQNEASPEFEIPCVRYGELYHMYEEVINEVINRTNLDKSELKFSHGNEILLPSAGEDPLDIGSASALLSKDVAIGRTINVLRPKIESFYSSIFVSYYINQKLRRKISRLAKGVSISNVYNSDLKTLSLNLPSLPEQQKIASFLTSVDKRISQLKRKKQLLAQYKKGIMQQIFSQQLRFKKENGAHYPNWEKKNLDSFLSIPQKVEPEFIDTSKILTVKLHLKGVHVNERTESLKLGATKYILRKKGQFIFGKQNIFNGAIGIVPDEFDGFYSSGDVPALDFKDGLVIPAYFIQFFGRRDFYARLESIANGSGSKRLHEKDLLDISVNMPCLEEQTKIANFLSAIDNKITQTQKQIALTQQFKKGLLQQMFV
jgi:type I restriction enzyme S subunit